MTVHSTISRTRIPRDKQNDYTPEAAAKRRAFVEEQTRVKLEHVGQYSFSPSALPGNVENFIGVAQVPIGLAGPLRINGEHAKGDFYVPLATSEGTLVASYSRGMRLLSECGGVKTTVVEQYMQRSPVSFGMMPCRRVSSANGSKRILMGSKPPRRRRHARASCRISINILSGRCATSASTTRQGMRPDRT